MVLQSLKAAILIGLTEALINFHKFDKYIRGSWAIAANAGDNEIFAEESSGEWNE